MSNNNIAEIRKSLHLERIDLAEKLNVDIKYIYFLERQKTINKITLFKIEKALNTTEKRIFDFNSRSRRKPDFNPHYEAFWTQGHEAFLSVNKEIRASLAEKLLSVMGEELFSLAPISSLMHLNNFNLYCIKELADDVQTIESNYTLGLLFSAALVGAEFFVCVAVLDDRPDIIQSFLNGLCNAKEPYGGKDGYNNIRIIREQYGLSMTALSQKSKVSMETLRLIEKKNHYSDVHLDKVKKLARTLNCELSDLFSPSPKDIYNIQAKQAGSFLRKKCQTKELQNALKDTAGNVRLSVREIVAFLNKM